MSIIESLRTAFGSLVSNKMRSILTMLGIIIGVGSVIALQAIGQGTIDTAQKNLERAGTNLVTIQPASQSSLGIATGTTNNNLTYEDALALAAPGAIPAADSIEPEYFSGGQLVAGSHNTFGATVGTSEQWPSVHDATITSGAWFTDVDVSSAHSVIVLGATVAQTLFPDGTDPIGQHVSVRRTSFQVVAVLAAKGGSGFGSIDNQAYVPITTAQQRLFGFRPGGSAGTGKPVNSIVMKAANQNDVDTLIAQASNLLRDLHKIGSNQADDFQVVNQQDQLQAAKDQQATFNLFLLVIASISLFVGGIGIMNIMLVTVTERTREIGIRKAIGARPRDILFQFMIESITLCFIGGLIGMVLGIVASFVVDATFQHSVVSPGVVVIAIAFAVAVGLFFGIYPARRASKLNPIDALRYD
jgi:putative ABC transport system permease protein